jgi:hypothetical protein
LKTFTTRGAAKKLGMPAQTLFHYIRVGKVPTPNALSSGDVTIHIWTEQDIEHVRQLLPKIANGRKTRYKKKQSAVSTQQSAKTKKKKK